MNIRLIAATAITMSMLGAGAAHAALIGSNVTGSLQFNGGGANYFDPLNGFVPAGPENKTLGTTVPVSLSNLEFGFADSANTDSANFSANTLEITDVAVGGNNASSRYTFTDVEFTSLSLIFTDFTGSLAYSLVGDTITIDFGAFGTAGTYTTIFNLESEETVPEPATVALFAAGLAGAAALRRRKAKRS